MAEQSFTIYDNEAEALEKNASLEQNQSWARSQPAVHIVIEKAYGTMAETAEDIVKLVFLKGKEAIAQLSSYLVDNLGTKDAEAKKIALQIQNAVALFLPPATVFEWDDPALLKAFDEFEKQWGIKDKHFREAVKKTVGAGGEAVRELPEYLKKDMAWSTVRAYTIADALAEKVLSRLPVNSFPLDEVRITWQKTGNVNAQKAVREMAPTALPVPQPAQIVQPRSAKNAPLAQADDEMTLFAARIVKELGLSVPNKEYDERLKQAVLARVREIRNALNTQELFERSFEHGGLGLTHTESVKAAARIEDMLTSRLDDARRTVLRERQKKQGSMRMPSVTQVALPSQVRIAEHHALAPYEQHLPRVPVVTALQTMDVSKPQQPQSSSTPMQPHTASATRPMVHDIIPPESQLEGPLESLAQLRLIDFRRLSAKPELAINKLKDRIMLLRQDSFGDYTRGIAAYRRSPLYMLYVNTLKGGLDKGAITLAAQAAGLADTEILTSDEFLNLIRLSKELQYS